MSPSQSAKCTNGSVPARNLVVLACFGLVGVACHPGGPSEPEPADISAEFRTASGAEPSAPLRLAVTWRQNLGTHPRWVTSFDGPVAGKSRQVVTVALPPATTRSTFYENSRADIECGNSALSFLADVIIPRFVVYEDVDGNGRFDPDLPVTPGIDRIWAFSNLDASTAVVAFTDLDAVLAKEPTEAAECIRELTQGQYTAFLMASPYSDYVVPVDAPLTVSLDLSPTDYARVMFGCGSVVTRYPTDYSDKTYTARNALVDIHVDSDECTNSPYPCSVAAVDVSDIALSGSLSYPGYSRTLTCVAAPGLDVLWYSESTLVCKGCKCSWAVKEAAWVAKATALPESWPCGKSIAYCSDPQASTWVRPSYCSTLTMTRPL